MSSSGAEIHESEVVCTHGEAVSCVAQSTDGKWLASGGYDNAVRVCRRTSGESPSHYEVVGNLDLGHPITSIALAEDGHRLAVIMDTGAVRVYRIEARGALVEEQSGISAPASSTAAAFSADGKWLVLCGDMTSIWQLSGSQRPRNVVTASARNGSAFLHIAISPDSRWIAGGTSDGAVIVWDTLAPKDSVEVTRHPIKEPTGDADRRAIFSLQFSHDSRWLVAAGVQADVETWHTVGHAANWRRFVLRGHKDVVPSFSMSDDSRRLATVSWDGTARLWHLLPEGRIEDGQVLQRHTDHLRRAVLSPNGYFAITVGTGGLVWLWSRVNTSPTSSGVILDGPPHGTDCVRISRDSMWAIAARGSLDWDSADVNAYVWSLGASDPTAGRRVLVGHKMAIVDCRFSVGSQGALTASCDGTVRYWELGNSGGHG